jgi:hypothetical protein
MGQYVSAGTLTRVAMMVHGDLSSAVVNRGSLIARDVGKVVATLKYNDEQWSVVAALRHGSPLDGISLFYYL